MQLQGMSSDAEDDISPMSSQPNTPRSPAAAAGPPAAEHFPSGLIISHPSSDDKGPGNRSGASSPQHSSRKEPSIAATLGRPQSGNETERLQGATQVQEMVSPSDALRSPAEQPIPSAVPHIAPDTHAHGTAASQVGYAELCLRPYVLLSTAAAPT